MWLMLQQDKPDDYVVATGETHSVREFLDEVFGLLDLDWKKYVEIDPALFPARRGGSAAGRPRQGRRTAGLEAERDVQGTGENDDRGRLADGQARAPAGERP